MDVSIESQDPQTAIKPSVDTPLKKWLASFGVNVERSLVLDSTGSMLQNLGGGMTIPTAYPAWVSILVNNTNSTHPVTTRFGGMSLLWGSPLSVESKEGIKTDNLLWSTPKSWLMLDQFTLDPEMAKFSLQMGGAGTQKSYTMGISLQGVFSSYYNQNPKPAGLSDEVIAKSPESRIIVLGDSDFATDLIGQTVTAQGNLSFLDNAVDYLAQDEALLSIKSRPQRDRSLNALKAEDGSASWAYWSLILINAIIVPLGLVTYGIIRGMRRRLREKGEKA